MSVSVAILVRMEGHAQTNQVDTAAAVSKDGLGNTAMKASVIYFIYNWNK